MALAGAKLFVDEGAYVFITGRRQEALDEAVKLIGRNVTAVQGDAANLDDLDRLFDTVRREKGAVDVLWASAGTGEQRRHHEITEEHFDAAFGLNARGTLFTVQKALPLFNDGGSIIMTGSNASQRGYPGWSVYAASKAVQQGYARVWAAELKDRGIRVNVLTPGQVATAKQENDDTTGMNPTVARPAATPSMACSVIPICRKRSGCAVSKAAAPVETPTSASSITMRGSSSASSVIVRPNTTRSALPVGRLMSRLHGGNVGIRELGERRRQLVVGGNSAMPAEIALHVGNSPALHRVGDHHRRPAGCGPGFLERADDRCHVVPVNLGDRPAERRPAD